MKLTSKVISSHAVYRICCSRHMKGGD